MKFQNFIKNPLNFQIISSLILTILFYLPFIIMGNVNKSYISYSDNINLWIPQIYNSFFLNNNFIFKGIDYFTHGGASEYFLRPNIIVYNPIILLFSFLIDFNNINHVVFSCLILIIIHSFLACLFTQKICKDFLKLDIYLSLLAGTLFTFSSIIVNNMFFMPFILIAYLTPVLLYFLLSLNNNSNLFLKIIFVTFISVTIYTSGYIVLAVFAIGLCVLYSCYHLYISKSLNYKSVFRILIPIILSSFIVFPLCFGMLEFHDIVGKLKLNLFQSAYEFGTSTSGILTLISNAVKISGEEKYLISIGIIPFFICIAFIFILPKYNVNNFLNFHKKIAIFSFGIFFLIFLSSLGQYSPLSFFFHYIPIIGSSHIYTRYLIPSSLFLFIAIAIIFDVIIEERKLLNYEKILISAVLFLIIIAIFLYLELPLKNLTSEYFLFEILLFIFFIVCFFVIKKKNAIVFVSILIIFFNSLNTNWSLFIFSIKNEKRVDVIHELIDKNFYHKDLFIEYLKRNSDKKIIKIVDISPYFEKGFFNKNIFWMLKKDINISSYSGYELHLSRNHEYGKLIPYLVSSAGILYIKPSLDWLKKTGADFLIYDSKFEDSNKDNSELFKYLDNNKILKLPNNNIVAKIDFPDSTDTVFNNGYIRVKSNDVRTKITDFKTNNTNYFKFKVNSSDKSVIEYLFWPNSNLKVYVNGKKTFFSNSENLSTINLNSGENSIKIIYKNRTIDTFLFLYFSFLIIFIITIIFYTFTSFSIFISRVVSLRKRDF